MQGESNTDGLTKHFYNEISDFMDSRMMRIFLLNFIILLRKKGDTKQEMKVFGNSSDKRKAEKIVKLLLF